MASVAISAALLGASFEVLLDRLTSPELIDFFRSRNHDLVELKLKLVALNKVLNDAEKKQITNRAVKDWLDELKDAVYHAEDLVDEIATKALQRKVEAEYQSGPSLVQSLISFFPSLFERGIDSELEKMIGKLDKFMKAIDKLGLIEVDGETWSNRLETTSLVGETRVYGRENDTDEIMKVLLSDGETSNEMDVIPIVGMSGLGKTTLAQLLYNDGRLVGRFDKKAWVCVSDKFDVLRITRTIVEKVTGGDCDAKDLDSLQVKLKESLSGKKFIIVLDDVWNENYGQWNDLITPLKFGAHGSKIIVTTRKEGVARIVKTVPFHVLQLLQEDDCWKLFCRHAFEKEDSKAHPILENIGMEIVRKCKGLPLAAKALGGLLRSQQDVKHWNSILESSIWELSEEESNILPVLRLSYHYLPSHLKRCFAYCSIFPKDYEFNMKELVSTWIAEGFLEKPKSSKTLEEEGCESFHQLLSRSFFQISNANNSLFVMHDLIHDLAQSVIGELSYRLEDGKQIRTYEKVRHFSYVAGRIDTFDKFKVIMDAKYLRTFLQIESRIHDKIPDRQWLSKKVLDEILLGLTRLRLLSLPRYHIVELPNSIGKLIHLRFLNLSDTLIKQLPESICTLYNLETLLLSNCRLLTTLPSELVKLILLRRLDLSGTNLKEMPMQMSRLKHLQELTAFIVGKGNGSGIKELKELHLLRGTISISGLQNVKSGSDASKANLRKKKHLEKLALEWGSTTDDSQNGSDVLEKLEPHKNLKCLEIRNYGGTSFPTWLTDQSFSDMVSLSLENCEFCFSLPPLGQLPSLKELTITRMPMIRNVGPEFYGESSYLSKSFGSLETLRFKEMLERVDWCILDVGIFSRLQKLEIIKCPKLIGNLPANVHSLVRLEIRECEKLVASLSWTTSIRELVLQRCPGISLEWQGMTSVEIVEISTVPTLKEFASELSTLTNLKELSVSKCRKLVLPRTLSLCYTSLERLSLSFCFSLVSLPLGLFPKVRSLKIEGCENFENLLIPDGIEIQNLPLLEILIIHFCDNKASFPCGGISAPNLFFLWVRNCKKLRALPENMHTLLPSLKLLMVLECPEIESFPQGDLPSKLHALSFKNCKKLLGGWRDWGLQTLPSLGDLILAGESEDMAESFPEEGLLPSTLTKLRIGHLKNLKSLNKRGLQLLGSLRLLEIQDCPQLKSLPEEGLPTSLFELRISGCPLLKPRCRREGGDEWHKIARIPLVVMDGEAIFDQNYLGPPESSDPTVSFSDFYTAF